MKWEDTTSYCQRDKDKVPTTFSVKHPDLRITVTNGHIDYRGEWIMHCPQAGISSDPLGVKTLDEAQKKAINLVSDKIAKFQMSIQEIKSQLG